MGKKLRFALVIVIALAVALSAGSAAGPKQTDFDSSAPFALIDHPGEEKGLQEEEEEEGEEGQDNLASQAKISEERAEKVAEKAVGGTATDVELDKQNGNVVYEVDVGDKQVIVNAKNGKVLSVNNNGENDSEDDDTNDDNDSDNN